MFDYLSPLEDSFKELISELPNGSIGQSVLFWEADQFEDLEDGDVVLFSIAENRLNKKSCGVNLSFDNVRQEFYQLMKGNWAVRLIDFGVVNVGNELSDTYFAIRSFTEALVKKGVVPLVLAGAQDLFYSSYRGFDSFNTGVNVVNIDAKFDIGSVEQGDEIVRSYVGEMIVNSPFNLFNYTNIGYQSCYVSQQEHDLMHKLYFDSLRIGEVVGDLSVVEPFFRNADLVSLDLGVIQGELGGNRPNGFNNREICALSRYVGISDKVKFFGIYEYDHSCSSPLGDALLAQIMWYFVEGYSLRFGEGISVDNDNFFHYNVCLSDDLYSFYKSKRTERWWVELPLYLGTSDNKNTKIMLPCSHKDYLDVTKNKIPERWLNAKKRYQMLM